jgi:RNA polymerase primary sigma factor
MLQPEISIDDFVDGEEGTRMAALLVDPKAENPLQRVHDIEMVGLVRKALLCLDDRERHIVRNRFGLLGGAEQTLEEIGDRLRLSRERIRQIERQAKRKLRASLLRHLGLGGASWLLR